MRDAGSSAEQVYEQTVQDGIDPITRVQLIRAVFGLSAGQAKEVILRAEGLAKSLDDHQEKIAKTLQSRALPSGTAHAAKSQTS